MQLTERTEDVILTPPHGANVPHVVRHSPTGFSWGYGGSGPADLALSILCAFVDRETAEVLYQQFKWDVISSLRGDAGHRLDATLIRHWIANECFRREAQTVGSCR